MIGRLTMRHGYLILFCLIALAAIAGCRHSGAARCEARASWALRVMTYNIHHCSGSDSDITPQATARVIRAQRPDLVALQEVDVGTARVGGRDLAAELASLTDMQVVFAKAMDYQGGEYGLAILSRYPVGKSTVVHLPGRAAAEPRIALIVEIILPRRDEPLRMINVHLDHVGDETDRLAQSRAIAAQFGLSTIRTILAGDFNARPDSQTIRNIDSSFTDTSTDHSPTYPSGAPQRTIDYIFVSRHPGWQVGNSTVPVESAASDHRPVVVDLTLTQDH